MFAFATPKSIYIDDEFKNRLEILLAKSTIDFVPSISMEWIEEHERCHQSMGHFELLGGLPTLQLITRSKKQQINLGRLPKRIWNKVERCVELQADHEAFSSILGAFDCDEIEQLRVKIASVSAVMILIENFDSECNFRDVSHPSAATRIFQLLGHVTEMWSIKASLENGSIPSSKQVQAFASTVILPAYWDAVDLALLSDAKSIANNLGKPESFFADVMNAKLGNWSKLETQGAKEWSYLKEANEIILPFVREFLARNS